MALAESVQESVAEKQAEWLAENEKGQEAIIAGARVRLSPIIPADGTIAVPPSPVGVWKIALGVFLGNLMFAIIAGIIYSINR